MINTLKQYCLYLLVLFTINGISQTYNIGDDNLVENECEGTLLDTGDGQEVENGYTHLEDNTFTICVDFAEIIYLNFSQFETEANFDFISIYLGPDTSGTPILLNYSGTVIPSVPPIIGEECVTIHFVTDDNVEDDGFTISWEAEVEPPPLLPPFDIGDVSCYDESFIVTLESPIDCASVASSQYFIFGGDAPLASAQPLDCVDGLTQTLQIDLLTPFQAGGVYDLLFDYSFADICGNLVESTGNGLFLVFDCPLEVDINGASLMCGGCEQYIADVTGGDNNYTFIWNPPLPGGDIQQDILCLEEDTWLYVTVLDGSGQAANDSLFITVCPFSVSIDIATTSFCGDCEDMYVNVFGGTPPFDYQWSPTLENADSVQVCPDQDVIYQLLVTDALGSTANAEVDLTVCPLAIDLNGPSVLCSPCDWLYSVASGGGGQYTYSWSPPFADNPDQEICITVDQNYTVTVTDQYGNAVSDNLFVEVCPYEIDIQMQGEFCNGECGPISVDISGGSGNYFVEWDPPLPSGANVLSDTICPDAVIQYTVTVTDTDTNQELQDQVTIQFCPLTVDADLPIFTCEECVWIEAIASGGDGNYTYSWDPPMIGNLYGDTVCIADPTYFTVTVTDGMGNEAMDQVYVTDCPFEIFVEYPDVVCNNNCEDVWVAAYGGDWDFTYVWSDPSIGDSFGPYEICIDEPTEFSVQVTDGTGASLIFPFFIDICPFNANIEVDSLICGGCDSIQVNIGGAQDPIVLSWNIPGMQNTNESQYFCFPEGSTELITYVTDNTGETVTDTVIIQHNPNPIAIDEIELCWNDNTIDLQEQNGGTWSGSGVIGNGDFALNPAGTSGNYWIYYTELDCVDSTEVAIIDPTDFAPVQSACINGASFQIDEPNPTGGTWSGNNITVNGMFTPIVPGINSITYTTLDGCISNHTVMVENISFVDPGQAICGDQYHIIVSPLNGWWDTYPGLDVNSGLFDLTVAGVGNHNFTYHINGGCSANFELDVVTLDFDNTMQICPQNGSIVLPLTNEIIGIEWTSNNSNSGLINPELGIFNPNVNNGDNFSETLQASYSNCTEQLIIEVVETQMLLPDTITLCIYEDPIVVNNQVFPLGGIWTGNGLSLNSNDLMTFFPDVAGAGHHEISYLLNDCEVDMVMVVEEVYAGDDMVVCDVVSTLNVGPGIPSGGLWSGTGIVNQNVGIFSPLSVGQGVYDIYYTTNFGCQDAIEITVEPLGEADIEPLPEYLCHTDTLIQLVGEPTGGVFSGPGVVGNTFNPIMSGPIPVLITYTVGSGSCETEDFHAITIGNELGVIMPNDTLICLGNSVQLSAFGIEGSGSNYTYNWSQGIGDGQVHVLEPTVNTTYTVTVNDGCSAATQGSFFVTVADTIQYSITQTDTLCFGEMGNTTIHVPANAAYVFDWQHDHNYGLNYIDDETGYFYVEITDTITGCSTELEVSIPHYPLLEGDFETNPNPIDCADVLTISLIDYSTGIDSGSWDMGDGTVYDYGNEWEHTYEEPGSYIISLSGENIGGCTDFFEAEFCIELPYEILVPNAFSPNNDSFNDTYKINGLDIATFSIFIADRWGKICYESSDINESWDGTIDGEQAEIGVYVYQIEYSTNLEPEEFKVEQGNITLLR